MYFPHYHFTKKSGFYLHVHTIASYHNIVQNAWGPKLSRLGHHVSICRKIFMFASKQCPQVPKHFEICGKVFAVQVKTSKTIKSFGPQMFCTIHYFMSLPSRTLWSACTLGYDNLWQLSRMSFTYHHTLTLIHLPNYHNHLFHHTVMTQGYTLLICCTKNFHQDNHLHHHQYQNQSQNLHVVKRITDKRYI